VIALLAPFVLLLLSAACLFALAASDGEPAAVVPGPLRRVVSRVAESERSFASGLGWPQSRWFVLRAMVLAAAVAAGVASAVPVLLVVDVLLGLTVPRFVLASLVDRSRVHQARAFLSFMSQVAERLRARDLELSAVVRAAAGEAPHEVSELLAPVAGAGADVFGTLVRQAARERSAPLERCCSILLQNQEHNLATLARLIGEEVTTLEAELDGEDVRVAQRAESRWTVLFMGVVILGFAAVLNAVPSMHEVLLTARGQLGLIVAVLVFAATSLVMSLLLRSPGMSRWDLERMHRELSGGLR
jgi:Flp pilus assembly protein TadB